mmetsp:Transcript_105025/g.279444  ORF Transcript_105025/g.279444 Transcript_105025/m.279444 type:complete len:430 (-) Transcript_105025:44-1333(-)|eukprot:CAMPEP_0171211500 /NCGR_PEP_ID=MMETSP0790-20130122/29654_1 /TAXON_ID=2925 /ORGANISM="Alexandrium catenella, Strain OF101" /LENGTH=429 /DNA_ID=CAMNT_0011677165 /DNA_START=11 /DNA_END=1300 /DNA_ORIENTATION=-
MAATGRLTTPMSNAGRDSTTRLSASERLSKTPSPEPIPFDEGTKLMTGATMRSSKTQPLWRHHDMKAQKAGQRSTIYWVGKSIMGEDNQATGGRLKGASYNGEWDNNKKNGYGVQVYPSGEKYEGQWSDGLRSGEGTLWVPVGKAQKLRKLYVGGWKDDKRHGRGTCFFKNGQFFQGYWDQGQMHGHGTLRYENGDLYIGEWHNGLRSGQGTLNKANGDCYEGYWLNDKREGSGSFFYAESGKVFVGEWANDLPKAGVYTQASPNPEQATSVPQTTTLPPVRLAMPTHVLEGALLAVRNARKAFRAQAMPVNRLFSEEEVEALRSAFQNVQQADGTIQPPELQALCTSLGTEVPMPRVRQLLTTVGLIREGETTSNVHVNFEGFLRAVAVLLEEETAMPQDFSQGEMNSELFAEYLDEGHHGGYEDEED